jgi:hypothetical protein
MSNHMTLSVTVKYFDNKKNYITRCLNSFLITTALLTITISYTSENACRNLMTEYKYIVLGLFLS